MEVSRTPSANRRGRLARCPRLILDWPLRRSLLALCCGTAVGLSGCQSSKLFSKTEPDPKTSFQAELEQALQQDRKLPSGASASGSLAANGTGNVGRLIQQGDQALSEHVQNPARLSEARNHFEEVLRIEPNNAVAHHRLGVIGDLGHNFGDAEKHYAQALRANPNDGQLLHDIGYSYMLQEKPAEAIPYLKRSLDVSPGFDMAARKLADAYVRTRQTELAQQTLRQVLPEAQVGAEIDRLQAAHDPARKPSLFGRMRDLRPEEATPDSPTQQLIADLERARSDSERTRLEKQQAQFAQQQAAAGGWPQRPPLHDSQISQAMAAIDYQSRPPAGQPMYIDPRAAGNPNFAQHPALVAGPNAPQGWSPPATNPGSHAPAGGPPFAGPMSGGQVPSGPPAGVVPSQPVQMVAAEGRPQAANPGFQYAEVIRGTQRGTASPEEAYLAQQQQQPQRSMAPWGMSTPQSPIPQNNGIDMASGRYTPGSLGDARQNPMGGPVESATYTVNTPGRPGPNGLPGQRTDLPHGYGQPMAAGAPAVDEYQAAAALGMGAGPGQMFPVIRRAEVSSPGTGSLWNGAQFPQPGRQLPTDRPITDLSQAFQQPGLPNGGQGQLVTGPNSLGQQMPAGGQYYTAPNQFNGGQTAGQPQTPSQQWTASSFQMQPNSAGADHGLQGYDQMRSQADSQLNSAIQQVQGQYPSSMMATPSYGLPVERPDQGASQMNSWYDRSTVGAPANQRTVVTPQAYPNSTQPVQPANAPLTPQIAPQTSYDTSQSQLPPPQYGQNVVVPPAYGGAANNWQTNSAPMTGLNSNGYQQPNAYQSVNGYQTGGGYQGPLIVPGN